MYTLIGSNIDDIYHNLCHDLTDFASFAYPKGIETQEFSPAVITLDNPHYNILANSERNASWAFMAAELLWILFAQDDVAMPSFYNQKMRDYSDDGRTLAGAYGPRIAKQMNYVYETLKSDPHSRQAIITIWTPNPTPSKDIPCTVMMHFMMRQNLLNLNIYMRSNDAWLGFPYDVHNFTCIQIIMAKLLKVNVGQYNHFAGSMHLYAEHFGKAQMVRRQVPTSLISGPITYQPRCETPYEFMADLDKAKFLEQRIRHAYAINPSSIELAVAEFPCPFFKQKLEWLLEKARTKYESANR